jgi:CRP-like cAMP-binding protein
LEGRVLQRLVDCSAQISIPRGSELRPTAKIYLVFEGLAAVSYRSQMANTRIVQLLKPGALWPLPALRDTPSSEYAKAITDLRCAAISVRALMSPEHEREILSSLAFEAMRQADELKTWAADLATPLLQVDVRLARLLMGLVTSESGQRIPRLFLSDMAQILGTTAETISRTLSKLRRLGLLSFDDDGRGLTVDAVRLTNYAQQRTFGDRTPLDDPSLLHTGAPKEPLLKSAWCESGADSG